LTPVSFELFYSIETMKKLFTILLFIYAGSALAQEKTQQTNKFAIVGEVEKESVITMDSLKQYTISEIGDINVTDHTGAFKHKDDKLKGVLLKDVLSHTKFKTTSPETAQSLSTLFALALMVTKWCTPGTNCTTLW
jgi:hypothetical protein